MRVASILLFTLGFTLGASAQGFPLGDQFQVNTYTDDFQEWPAVAADDDGNFVVVWLNDNVTPPWVSGQLFLADGTKIGAEFQVSTLVGTDIEEPAVAMTGDGRFVVVWEDNGGLDGDGASVRGQRFAADGTKVGGEMQINTYTTGFQGSPAVDILDNGSFMVVWHGQGSHATNGIHGQAFDWAGVSLWGEIGINDHIPAGGCAYPEIGIADDTDFVVSWDAWGSPGNDQSGKSVQARCFVWNGTALGPQFQVNTTTNGDQSYNALAVAPDGSFLVVYYGLVSYGVGAQRFTPSCAPAGGEFEVNSPSGPAYRPDISVDDGGRYIVTWSNSDKWGRLVPVSGEPTAEPFLLPSEAFSCWYGEVAAAPDGRLVTTWHSNGSAGTDNDGYSIQARLFAGFTGVFFDDFESGDLSGWAATTP
jgi:hypothetical protein